MSRARLDRCGLAAATALLLLVTVLPARAEEPPGIVFQELGFAVDIPTGVVLSLSYTPSLRLFEDHLRLGLGARFTSWLGGSDVVFKSVPDGAQYTLTVDPQGVYSLNLMLAASWRIVAGLEVGFNIDLIGVGFGGEVTGTYAGSAPFSGTQSAKPPTFGIFLFGPADKGQLNSELFAAWWFGGWGVRTGISHVITEYVTVQPLDAGNDRFRSAITRFFAAAGYRF